MKMRYQATEVGANNKVINTLFLVLNMSPKGEAVWVTNLDNQHLTLGHLSNDPALFLFELEDACAIGDVAMRERVILNALKHYGRPNLTWAPLATGAAMAIAAPVQETGSTFSGMRFSMDDLTQEVARLMALQAETQKALSALATYDFGDIPIPPEGSCERELFDQIVPLLEKLTGKKPAWAQQEPPAKPVRARNSSVDLGM